MKIYIKNIDANVTLELEAKDKWLEEKPSDVDTHAYLCDRYIKTQSKNVRHLFSESSKGEFDTQELKDIKQKKIKQMKKNRDFSLETPMDSVKAFEYGTNKEVYFKFRTKSTGNALTEPSTIMFRALGYQSVKYSCKIVEEGIEREGYVEITKDVAENLSSHLQLRATTNIQHANELEEEINSIELDSFISLEEAIDSINNINIDF